SQKFNAALLQAAHGSDDVRGVERNMLHAGTAIEIQVFFNLRFAASLGRFVDGEFDAPTAILHDFRHQSRVLGADGAIIKVDELGKAHDALVKRDPFVHLAKLYSAKHVVNGRQIRATSATKHTGFFV